MWANKSHTQARACIRRSLISSVSRIPLETPSSHTDSPALFLCPGGLPHSQQGECLLPGPPFSYPLPHPWASKVPPFLVPMSFSCPLPSWLGTQSLTSRGTETGEKGRGKESSWWPPGALAHSLPRGTVLWASPHASWCGAGQAPETEKERQPTSGAGRPQFCSCPGLLSCCPLTTHSCLSSWSPVWPILSFTLLCVAFLTLSLFQENHASHLICSFSSSQLQMRSEKFFPKLGF